MTTQLAHPIDEALERFTLVHGAGNWDNNQACVATLLAWTMGYEFSDHLECAHPILNTLAIKANDHPDTTHDGRARIVRAGADGLLDTWWVPTLVIVRAMADVDQDLDPVERAVQILDSVAWWKSTRTRVDADLRYADLSSADLRYADLSSANLSSANLSSANLSSASGNAWTVLPDGWKVNDAGLIVPEG